MRVRLLKKTTTANGTYVMGRILTLTQSYAQRLIDEGRATEYTGPYPPPEGRNGKMITNLFKPKDNGNN
jgi:hypothetical protein